MRRLFITLPIALVLFVGAAVPVYAANLPLFDSNFSIVPKECQACPCDYGGILQLIQNVMNAAVSVGVLAFILVAVYAGATFMLNPTNPEGRTKAKSMLFNVVIGLFIVLASWLFVDFIMKTLYAGEHGSAQYGPWNKVLSPVTPGAWCILPKQQSRIGGLEGDLLTGIIGGNGPGAVPAGTICSDSNPNCSVQAIMAQGLSTPQAQALSCIAVTESSGNANAVNPDSLACGTFQLTNKTSKSNWQNPANHGPGCSVSTPCTNAACNLQTATILFKQQGYQPWTCPGCNAKAASCVAKYDPGH